MWNRKELKANARDNFKRNYWMSVVVALIITFFIGGGGGFAAFRSYLNLSNMDNPISLEEFLENPLVNIALLGVIGIIMGVSILFGFAYSSFLLMPLETGCCRFFLDNHNEPAKLDAIGFSFKHYYFNIVKTQFLKTLFLFLWTLLGVIPECILAMVATAVFHNSFAQIGVLCLSWLFILPMIIKTYSYRLVSYILADDPEMEPKEVLRLSSELMKGQKWKAFVLDLSFLGWNILQFFTCGLLGLFYVNPYRYSANAELYLCIRYHIAEGNPGGYQSFNGPAATGMNNGTDAQYSYEGTVEGTPKQGDDFQA